MPPRKSRSGPSINQAQRRRKIVGVTLSDAARDALASRAAETGEPKSVVLDRLILEAATRGWA